MNINAAELARKLETNPANISYWFGNKCKSLSPKNKAKIKNFLGAYYKEHSNAITLIPDNETCLKIIEDYLNGNANNGRHLAKELASLLGITTVTLSRWRNRKTPISTAFKRQIPFLCRTANSAIAINNSPASINGDATTFIHSQDILDTIISEIMASDMCSDCKVKAFNILSKHK